MKVFRRRWPSLVVVMLTVSLLAVLSQAAFAKPPKGKGDPSLRGSWSLDEDGGQVAKDSSAYKNHAVISGATWVEGKFGSALAFDGRTDRVVVPASTALEPEHVSLSLWFRADGPPGRWRVLAYKGVIDCKASSFALKADEAGTGLVFMVWNGVGNPYTLPAATGVWDGEWHHAVGTFDGAEMRLYIDGDLVGSKPMFREIVYGLTNGDEFVIGHPANICVDTDPQYTGDIDDVQVWDRALSAKEVARLANPKTGKKPRR